MIILEHEQYSDEWWEARLGIPTASVMGMIVTSEGKRSTQWKTLLHKLAAETLRGKADEGFKTEWMKRGHEIEAEARSTYEFITDCKVRKVGLCYADESKKVGLSPDGLIGENAGLEVKCPSPGVQVGYLLDGVIPSTYRAQVYASLYLSGREFWDFFSYHPELEPLLITCLKTNEKYQAYAYALDKYLPMFLDELDSIVHTLRG